MNPLRLRLARLRSRHIPIDPRDCVHPARRLRFDGLWEGEGLASLTCLRCGTSLTVPVRGDVASAHGGALADSSMSTNINGG